MFFISGFPSLSLCVVASKHQGLCRLWMTTPVPPTAATFHELVAKAVEDARQSRKPYAAEFRVVRADGIVRWIASRGQFYYGSHGDTQRMLGIAVDITERRQVQEALHLFRKLIDQSSDAIEVV